MKSYETTAYIEAECLFYKSGPMAFYAVHGLTQGKVCDTGCAWFEHGRCPAYNRLIVPLASTIATASTPLETVREEAARRNLSISEVRRQRQQGEKGSK